MARLNDVFDPEEDDASFDQSVQSSRRGQERVQDTSPSPSPGASLSDKENHVTLRNASLQSIQQEKSVSLGPPQRSTPESSGRNSKKRKLMDRDAPSTSQVTHRRQLEEAGDARYYDPNQSMDERRAVRKEYRDLSRDLTGKQCVKG